MFRSLLGVDEATWLRARAWALAIAAMTLPYYWDTMPGRCAVGATSASTSARAHDQSHACGGAPEDQSVAAHSGRRR